MSDSQQPTERILPPPPANAAAPSRAPIYALLGVGIAILLALLVIIVLIVVPRPGQPASVAPVPTVPSSAPIPPSSASAPAPPAQEVPEPGFTSLAVATVDRGGISIKDACESLRSGAKQNRDRLEISIEWQTAGVEFVEVRSDRSDRSDLDANSSVVVELDCFTKAGVIASTDIELRAYDSEGDEVEVLTFRVFGNGDVAQND